MDSPVQFLLYVKGERSFWHSPFSMAPLWQLCLFPSHSGSLVINLIVCKSDMGSYSLLSTWFLPQVTSSWSSTVVAALAEHRFILSAQLICMSRINVRLSAGLWQRTSLSSLSTRLTLTLGLDFSSWVAWAPSYSTNSKRTEMLGSVEVTSWTWLCELNRVRLQFWLNMRRTSRFWATCSVYVWLVLRQKRGSGCIWRARRPTPVVLNHNHWFAIWLTFGLWLMCTWKWWSSLEISCLGHPGTIMRETGLGP